VAKAAPYALPAGAPKQQHYIPQAYTKRFANQAGLLVVYDLWDSGRLFYPGPRSAFKAKGLYNQPVHAERRLDASLETFFSKAEDRIPKFVQRLEAKESLEPDTHTDIIEYLCMMRTRVPSTLKAATTLLAEMVRREPYADAIQLPDSIRKIFSDTHPQFSDVLHKPDVSLKTLIDIGLLVVPIDPHRALTAMPHLVASLAPIFGRYGMIKIVHNTTDVPFLSNDNPVMYYSRGFGEAITPYPRSPFDEIELFAPLTPAMAIYSSTRTPGTALHSDISDRTVVDRLNRITVMFADRHIFSSQPIDVSSFTGWFNVCPIPEFENSVVLPSGDVVSIGYRFGAPIRSLPAFEYDEDSEW
jgi:hypothetical protein